VERPHLINLLFQGCDKDYDGFLNEEDLRGFAGLYDENLNVEEDSWSDLYRKICCVLCCRPYWGLDLAAFIKLVDREGSGCFCDDELLQWMVQEIQSSSGFDDQSQPAFAPPPRIIEDHARITRSTLESSLESLRRMNGGLLVESNVAASSSTSAPSTGYAFFDSESDEDAEVLTARMARAARGGLVEDVGISSSAHELYVAPQFREQDKLESGKITCRPRPRPNRQAAWTEWSWLSMEHKTISAKKKTKDVETALDEVSLPDLRAVEEAAEAEAAELELLAGLFGGRKVQVGGLQPIDMSDLVGGAVVEAPDPSQLSRQLFFNLAGTETALQATTCDTSFDRTIKKYAGIDLNDYYPNHNLHCATKLTVVTEDDTMCAGEVEEFAGMLTLEERHHQEQEQFAKERSRKEKSSRPAKNSWRQVAAMPKSMPICMGASLQQRSSGTPLPIGSATSRGTSSLLKSNGGGQRELGRSFAYKTPVQ